MALRGDELRSRLIDRIYDVAVGEARWDEILVTLADVTGSKGGILYEMDPRRQRVLGRALGRLDPEVSAIYEERHFRNVWADYMFAQPAGALVQSEAIIPLRELRRTAFYAEILHPQGLAHNLMSPLIAQEQLVVAFNLPRTNSEGPMSGETSAYVASLLPHLQRAAQLSRRLERYQALQEATAASLDLMGMGVVLLDRRGEVVFVNRSALSVMPLSGLSLRERSLVATGHAADRLRKLVADVLSGGAGGTMVVPDRGGERLPLTVLVAPLRGHVAAVVAAEIDVANVAVFIRDPNVERDTSLNELVQLFDLTPGEARVAALLGKGMGLRSAATTLGITVTTLKTHARRIFQKAGVRRHPHFVHALSERRVPVSPPQDSDNPTGSSPTR